MLRQPSDGLGTQHAVAIEIGNENSVSCFIHSLALRHRHHQSPFVVLLVQGLRMDDDYDDSCLKQWSPTFGPIKWILINSLCCLAAAGLFMIAATTTTAVYCAIDKEIYVLYNVVICLVWCAQASLITRYNPTWTYRLEFLVAFYFMLDAFVGLYQWKLSKVHKWRIFLDSWVDFIIYFYYLLSAIQAHIHKRREEAENNVEELYIRAETASKTKCQPNVEFSRKRPRI